MTRCRAVLSQLCKSGSIIGAGYGVNQALYDGRDIPEAVRDGCWYGYVGLTASIFFSPLAIPVCTTLFAYGATKLVARAK